MRAESTLIHVSKFTSLTALFLYTKIFSLEKKRLLDTIATLVAIAFGFVYIDLKAIAKFYPLVTVSCNSNHLLFRPTFIMENDEAGIESTFGGSNDCGDRYVPLTDTQRYIVIVAHYVSTDIFFFLHLVR